jgi:L-ascorbate metabolism protein UlaG (beta-lactamase superfamily)
MFELEYKGGNTIVLNNKKSVFIIDPKQSLIGLKDINTKDAIEISTEDRFSTFNPQAKLIIDGPGEYGIADVEVKGIPAKRHIDADETNQATVYRIEVEDARVAVLGNIQGKLTDEQLEELGIIDILVIPIGGGGYTLDATAAASLTRSIGAKVVIPVHYADKELKYEVPQDGIDLFIEELGAPVEEMPKLKYKKNSALPVALTIYKLARTS